MSEMNSEAGAALARPMAETPLQGVTGRRGKAEAVGADSHPIGDMCAHAKALREVILHVHRAAAEVAGVAFGKGLSCLIEPR